MVSFKICEIRLCELRLYFFVEIVTEYYSAKYNIIYNVRISPWFKFFLKDKKQAFEKHKGI